MFQPLNSQENHMRFDLAIGVSTGNVDGITKMKPSQVEGWGL